MHVFDLLKSQADMSFRELWESIDGLTQEQAWARVECQPDEYLHSEGSILSIVVHIAGGKMIYGSAAYRDLEVRWRDVIERMESFWPDWDEAKRFLAESQTYWLETWASEEDAERIVKSHRGVDWPSWKAISIQSHHDSYHAGQIQLLRSTLPPTSTPPPPEGDLWREACKPTYSW